MLLHILRPSFLLLFAFFCVACTKTPITGPLMVSEQNPRYFEDPAGNVVYTVGAHTWDNLQDMTNEEFPAPFDFDQYLDFLDNHGHNFIRLWRWESTFFTVTDISDYKDGETIARLEVGPHPWLRVGDEMAHDGKPKFDLTQFDPNYFQRLRERVKAAGDRGIYVSIMLFEGWANRKMRDGWKYNPFNLANNINKIDGDLNGDGKGLEIYTLENAEIRQLQELYISKVLETTNDLDNVLYEISNENHEGSFPWQNQMIAFIRNWEKSQPKQHLIGMTSDGGDGIDDTEILFSSLADWISPSATTYDYLDNPPDAFGKKVILSDTDHLWGVGGTREWAWKTFFRGLNPLFMDCYEQRGFRVRVGDLWWEDMRNAVGDTRKIAQKLDLAQTTPEPTLSSTGYCLAQPEVSYAAYQPEDSDAFEITLPNGHYAVEWYSISLRQFVSVESINVENQLFEFLAPFEGASVLILKRNK